LRRAFAATAVKLGAFPASQAKPERAGPQQEPGLRFWNAGDAGDCTEACIAYAIGKYQHATARDDRGAGPLSKRAGTGDGTDRGKKIVTRERRIGRAVEQIRSGKARTREKNFTAADEGPRSCHERKRAYTRNIDRSSLVVDKETPGATSLTQARVGGLGDRKRSIAERVAVARARARAGIDELNRASKNSAAHNGGHQYYQLRKN